MRKLIYGGAASACLAAGALGLYLSLPAGHEEPAGSEWVEEQEPPRTAPFPLGDLVHRPASGAVAEAPAADAADAAEAFEPIVVEGAVTEVPPATEIGGAPIPGSTRAALEPGHQPPRPDAEPGREPKMPYAGEGSDADFGAALWHALCRLFTGEEPTATQHEVHSVSPEETAVVVPEPPAPIVPPIVDYHHHEPHCPYTGRCPVPYYPAPPLPEK